MTARRSPTISPSSSLPSLDGSSLFDIDFVDPHVDASPPASPDAATGFEPLTPFLEPLRPNLILQHLEPDVFVSGSDQHEKSHSWPPGCHGAARLRVPVPLSM